MKKKVFVLLLIALFPLVVNATNSNSDVMSGSNVNICSRYQDSSISTSSDVYFSQCMVAKCSNNKYSLSNYNNNRVICSNGNTSPYSQMINNSECSKVSSRVCNNGQITYCSRIIYYDCGRTSNGDIYYDPSTTTTTTRRITQPSTTQVTTETPSTTTNVVSNTKLSSITLSSGKIDFNKDVYEYTLEIDSLVNSVNISAIPEDNTSTVKVDGNTNLKDGSVISITVTGSDNSNSVYRIKISKKETIKLSNNSKLKTLKIKGYDINFNSNITDYVLNIDSNTKELDIEEYETVDEKAEVSIEGNTDLGKNSVVHIIVTAEDGITTTSYNFEIKVKKKSNFLKILFIIILLLSILAGAYYLYQKFVASRSGEKYEYE